MRNGAEAIDTADEGLDVAYLTKRHARTAAGVTADGKLLIVTVDGRQPISQGVTLVELAELMKRLGSVNAINLDGGGSTTLSVKGLIVNSPCEGAERPVADALLVFACQPPAAPLPKLKITGVDAEMTAGHGTQLFLTWGDDSQMLTEDQLSSVIWGTTGGVGFVNQKGWFYPFKAFAGTVNALYAGQCVSSPVRVIAEPPATPGSEPSDE